MFGINASKFRGMFALVAVLTGAASATVTTPAHAAVSGVTTVNIVEYGAGSLLVQLTGGVNYFAQLNTQSGCTANNQTIDTIKAYQSLAQAALLAGKTVKVYFNTCGGQNYITALDLNQ